METLKSSDYYINYHGKIIDIKDNNKLLCLFIAGSGFGDGGIDRCGSETYYIYKTSKFGDELVKIGEGSSSYNGNDISCSFTINGIKTYIDGFMCDQFFNSIFKR